MNPSHLACASGEILRANSLAWSRISLPLEPGSTPIAFKAVFVAFIRSPFLDDASSNSKIKWLLFISVICSRFLRLSLVSSRKEIHFGNSWKMPLAAIYASKQIDVYTENLNLVAGGFLCTVVVVEHPSKYTMPFLFPMRTVRPKVGFYYYYYCYYMSDEMAIAIAF